jgi:hypothetical protein
MLDFCFQNRVTGFPFLDLRLPACLVGSLIVERVGCVFEWLCVVVCLCVPAQVIKEATVVPAHIAHRVFKRDTEDRSANVSTRLYRSTKLWALYADVEVRSPLHLISFFSSPSPVYSDFLLSLIPLYSHAAHARTQRTIIPMIHL